MSPGPQNQTPRSASRMSLPSPTTASAQCSAPPSAVRIAAGDKAGVSPAARQNGTPKCAHTRKMAPTLCGFFTSSSNTTPPRNITGQALGPLQHVACIDGRLLACEKTHAVVMHGVRDLREIIALDDVVRDALLRAELQHVFEVCQRLVCDVDAANVVGPCHEKRATRVSSRDLELGIVVRLWMRLAQQRGGGAASGGRASSSSAGRVCGVRPIRQPLVCRQAPARGHAVRGHEHSSSRHCVNARRPKPSGQDRDVVTDDVALSPSRLRVFRLGTQLQRLASTGGHREAETMATRSNRSSQSARSTCSCASEGLHKKAVPMRRAGVRTNSTGTKSTRLSFSAHP